MSEIDLAERCRIHADKMDNEGWYVTANVLWQASEALAGRPLPELPAVHSYMRGEANRLRQESQDDGKCVAYREAARRCASIIEATLRLYPNE